MGSDFSRWRFDPLRDYAAVLEQQGRVAIEADGNEAVAIIDRRLRAAAADLGSAGPAPGIAGTAVVPATTPDGFRITLAGGALSVGRGRMYVDGLLAENHGTGAPAFDPLLAEPCLAGDTPYLQQPYWPDPAPLPASGTHLVYLKVARREVTHLEDPGLIEQAVGVDTTARLQTIWQVGVHEPDTPGLTCETADADIPGWLDLIAPSAGRLTTGTVPVDAVDDPCELPPTGGYRGRENQAYRVEIRTAGPAGTATFTWARNNASVASAVVEVVAPDLIRPASLGRDDELSFQDGTWVEIVDDDRELAGTPGVLRKVTVDPDAGTLTLHAALPADLQLSTALARARHLRVRRWDQKGKVKNAAGAVLVDLDDAGAAGDIVVPASGDAVVLEDGVTVILRSPGGSFRSGDHWIFAARTNDTSVEVLDDAPPLGIHRHYARLAVVTFPGTVDDCRRPWPEPSCADCDCTVCVTPESHASGALTIQAAIDKVVPTGGTMCLAVGLYQLPATGARIAGANGIRVHGQGSRTVLIASRQGIEVRDSAFVTLEDFAVLSAAGLPAVRLTDTTGVTAQRLEILVTAGPPEPGRPPATGAAFALGGVSLRTWIRDNVVIAPVGVGVSAGSGKATAGGNLLTAALDIDGNVFLCALAGVSLEGTVAHVMGNTVRHNTIYRSSLAAVRALGQVGPGSSFTIESNTVLADGAGIEVGTSGFVVQDNVVTGQARSRTDRRHGIAVLPGFGGIPGSVRIAGNQVRDVGGTGIAVLAPVRDLAVSANVVELALAGIVMADRAQALVASVTDNMVLDVGGRSTDTATGIAGIQLVGARRAIVTTNTVSGVGTARPAAQNAAGIRVLAGGDIQVVGNAVSRVGSEPATGPAVGIEVSSAFTRALVDGNSSRRSPVGVEPNAPAPWTGLRIGEDPRATAPIMLGGYTLVILGQAYLIGHLAAFVSPLSDDSLVVDSNTVTGGGQAPAALVAVRGDAVVTGNHFQQVRDASQPALLLTATTATVQANRARGGKPSMALNVAAQRLAVVGNLTTAGIVVPGGALTPPWNALNLDGI